MNHPQAFDGDDTLFGGSGNDYLSGQGGNDLIFAGLGDDSLRAGNGDDLYRYSMGDGNDIILDGAVAGTDGGTDTVEFVDALASDVTFSADQYDLVVSFAGSSDRLTIQAQLASSNIGRRIESFQFSDGSVVTYQDVLVSLGL